ncbi:MAG: alginate lyase family protein [Candidatus Hydrogenedentes bacterium]|nr:alginate lyase family protein [Candidatus Hydrogenedentota bacterium]
MAAVCACADDATNREALKQAYPNASAEVIEKADKLLSTSVKTVMDKSATPPSGDKHDFLTLSPYHWPNTSTVDGKPYVMRDGVVNPEAETDKYDRVAYFHMSDTVEYCAVAWRLSGDAKYAEKAAGALRAWFVSPETRMSPNLNYAQFVPGVNKGSRTGIIRGMTILDLIDALRVLEDSGAWKPEDEAAWNAWLADFSKWLSESDLGKAESKALNNHGTWYDVMVATFAMEGGNIDLARQTVRDAAEKRIAKQIRPDGKQPLELARTKSWDYSVMNLDAMVRLAMLGRRLDCDLWNYVPDGGGGIRAALDYLLPFATGDREWEMKQIEAFDPSRLYPVVRRAAAAYPDGPYTEALAKFPADAEAVAMDHLMYFKPD